MFLNAYRYYTQYGISYKDQIIHFQRNLRRTVTILFQENNENVWKRKVKILSNF